MGKIILYLASCEPLKDNEKYRTYLSLLSPYRKNKISDMKLPDAMRNAVGAETLLRMACDEWNIDYSAQNILQNPYGKPYFEGNPLYFSLSHTDEIVACAVSDEPIGCDAERIREIDFGISDRFFTDDETAYIGKNQSFFYEIWTKKEAYVKCLGTGFHTIPSSFSVLQLPEYRFFTGERMECRYSVCAPQTQPEPDFQLREIAF